MNNEQIENRSFTLTECMFAWLCYFAGYAFCRCFPVMKYPLGGFLFILALFTVTIIIFCVQKRKFKIWPFIVALSSVAIAFSLLLSTNRFLFFWAFLYSITAYCYFVYAYLGNNIKGGFSDFIILDFLKATIILPFASFGKLLIAMFTGKAKSSAKSIVKIFIGIFITIIPTIIIIALLSYDSKFWDLLVSIVDFDIFNIFSHIFTIGCAFPIGMYLFGLYVSASENKCNGLLKADECTKNYQAIKFIPTLTIVSALVPIVFVYTVFFISQWEYYLSGFVGELPEDLSYAQYAREGFFQLCIVSVINLVIILFVALFMRRKVEEKSVVFRIISIVFTICNFILISTALSKMVMYIKSYGLTPKRIYATWFMCLIAVIFLIIVVSQFINKIKPIATTFVVCVLFLTGLSLSNIDGIIAGYNVDRYIDGSLNSVDMRAMEDLGDAAIPELVRLAEHLDSKYNTDISAEKCGSEDELYQNLHKKLHDTADYYKSHNDDMSIFEKNIPVVRAENALKRVNLG